MVVYAFKHRTKHWAGRSRWELRLARAIQGDPVCQKERKKVCGVGDEVEEIDRQTDR